MKISSTHFVLALGFVSATGGRAARIVLALYALALDAQPLTVGILAATFSAFPVLLSVPAGKLADRFGARWLLIVTTLGGGLAMLVPYAFSGLTAIFIAAAIMGLGIAIYEGALQNLIGLLSNPQHRTRDFSNLSVMWSAGNFVGPLIAGLSIDYFNHAIACLYVALWTMAPAMLLAIRAGGLPGGVRQPKHADGGVLTMLSEPGVRRVLAITSLQNAAGDLYQFYMPIYTYSVGLSATAIGIVLALYAIAMFVMRLLLPRITARYPVEKVLAWSFYVTMAGFVLVPFFDTAVALGLISLLLGLGMGCQGPIVTTLMFSNAPKGRSGEAMGLRMSVIHFTKTVGPVFFGSVGSAFGMFPVFAISALMMGAGGVLSQPRKSG